MLSETMLNLTLKRHVKFTFYDYFILLGFWGFGVLGFW